MSMSWRYLRLDHVAFGIRLHEGVVRVVVVVVRDEQLDEVVGDAQIAMSVHEDVGILGGEGDPFWSLGWFSIWSSAPANVTPYTAVMPSASRSCDTFLLSMIENRSPFAAESSPPSRRWMSEVTSAARSAFDYTSLYTSLKQPKPKALDLYDHGFAQCRLIEVEGAAMMRRKSGTEDRMNAVHSGGGGRKEVCAKQQSPRSRHFDRDIIWPNTNRCFRGLHAINMVEKAFWGSRQTRDLPRPVDAT
ncbi:hypothetical protein K438DRAFT_1756606 [Mycena galopus ATCC 62051]|nr:hypothetical protein K438DRAFT_1756606 [Mycena galopus ATCC 62051]